jgi:serine/threonine protein kinase
VLGDIKPQNILVNNRALPSIIDTDSFQVINPKNGKVYHCLVGSEGYTPPELIGKDFDSIEQTEVHDRFRLGVIIYQLLFGGNNPFQGKWTGTGEIPDINELICQGLWVNGSTNLIAAVARTIPLEIVHPEIQQCFLRCFNDGHKNPNFRPTARKWLEALKVGNDRLTICGRVDNHYYSRTYGKCYWCDRSKNLGVDIFPGVVKAKPSVSVQPTQSQASQTNQLVNSPRQVSQPVISTHQSQPVTISAPQTTIPVKNTKRRKVLIAAILGFIGTQIYGYALYSVFPVNPISVIASLPSGISLEKTLEGHSSSVVSVAYSPDNVNRGKLLQTLEGHSTFVYLAYSPDGQTLAIGSSDDTIKLWNVNTGNLLQTIEGHSNSGNSVAYSPDGRTFASGSFDSTIKLWNVKTGNLLQTLKGHSNPVYSVAYSPDGRTLASGSDDKTIKIWRLK